MATLYAPTTKLEGLPNVEVIRLNVYTVKDVDAVLATLHRQHMSHLNVAAFVTKNSKLPPQEELAEMSNNHDRVIIADWHKTATKVHFNKVAFVGME